MSAPSLADLIADRGPLSGREAVLIAVDLCAAEALSPAPPGCLVPSRVSWDRSSARWVVAPGPSVPSKATVPAGTAIARVVYFLLSGTEVSSSPVDSARLRTLRPDVPPAIAQAIDRALSTSNTSDVRSLGLELAAAIGVTRGAEQRNKGSHPLRRPWLQLALAAGLMLVLGSTAFLVVGSGRFGVWARERELSRQTLVGDAIRHGLAERGDSLVRLDDFAGATSAYERMAARARERRGVESVEEAWAEARLAWVRHLAGDHATAERHARLSIGILDRTAPADHPLQSTARLLLAMQLGQAGAFDEASTTVRDALERRWRALGLPQHDARIAAGPLARAAQLVPVEFENDEDGLLDLFEVCLRGPVASRPDSDGNGILDVDEDDDGDRWPDGLVYGASYDPSRMVAHYGSLDPVEEGFSSVGSLVGEAAAGSAPGWRLRSEGEGHYRAPLTTAQQRAAKPQGWRLITRLTLRSGAAVVHLQPHGTREQMELVLTRVDQGRISISATGVATETAVLRDEPLLMTIQSVGPADRRVLVRLGSDSHGHFANTSDSPTLRSEVGVGVRGSSGLPAEVVVHLFHYDIRF